MLKSWRSATKLDCVESEEQLHNQAYVQENKFLPMSFVYQNLGPYEQILTSENKFDLYYNNLT